MNFFCNIKTVTLLICLFVLLCGCQAEPPVEVVTPLITINGQEITISVFLEKFESNLQKDQPLTGIEREELQRSFLVQLIDRELIHGEAQSLEITLTDEEIESALQNHQKDYPGSSFEEMLKERGLTLEAWREELKQSLVMEKLLNEAVYSRATVTDIEISTYYDANRRDFDRPEQVRARQIMVASEEEGRQVLAMLRQGELFPEIAKEFSLSPDAEAGGDLGYFSRGEMPPEFDAVVFDLPVNRLSELIKSEYGFHIFLVEDKRKASRMKRKEAKEEVRKILEKQKREEVYLEWLQEMRARAEISVDWSQLEDKSK